MIRVLQLRFEKRDHLPSLKNDLKFSAGKETGHLEGLRKRDVRTGIGGQSQSSKHLWSLAGRVYTVSAGSWDKGSSPVIGWEA